MAAVVEASSPGWRGRQPGRSNGRRCGSFLAWLARKTGITAPKPRMPLSVRVSPSSRIEEYSIRLKTVYSSSNWPLYSKGDWPPQLSKVFINLKLVKHQKLLKATDEKLLASAMQYGVVDEIHRSVGYLHLDELFLQDDQLEKQETMRREPNFDQFGVTSMNLMVHEQLNPIKAVTHTSKSNECTESEPLIGGEQGSVHKEQGIVSSRRQNARSIKILADGVPGVGKTTLSRKVCKDWAEGITYLSQYTLIVFIPLRDDAVGQATELWQLLPHGNQALKRAVADELEYNEGENTLFIFDGWDELPLEYQKGSLVRKILEGKAFIECSVLVTSRSHASTELLRRAIPDRHVEITGLSEEQIKECITERFKGDEVTGKELMSQVEMRRQLLSLCYIPLNLSIVLYVYKYLETLPNTLTEIYEQYIKNVLIRDADLIQLSSLDDLPVEVQQTYQAITQVALDGLKQNTLEFSSKHLESLGCLRSESLEVLGLMTAYKTHTPSSGVVTKYQFTHLTMQEFLAAEALSRESLERQEEFVWKYMSDGRLSMMLQFFAGVTKLKQLEGMFKIPCPTLDYVRFRMFLRLAHESQNAECFRTIAQTSAGDALEVNCQRWRSDDMQILAPFVHWSMQKLHLSFLITRDYGETSFKQFLHFVTTSMNKRPPQNQRTSLPNFTLTIAERRRGTSLLCEPSVATAISSLHSLTKLVVKRKSSVTKPGDSYNVVLTALSKLPLLSSLALESEVDPSEADSAINSFSIVQFLSSRKTPFTLRLTCVKLELSTVDSIVDYLRELNCLLKELHLIKCGVNPAHFCSLLDVLASNTSLLLLNLSHQTLFLPHNLQTEPNCTAPPLLLKSMCSVVAEGIMAEMLTESLQRNKTLTTLELSHCGLDPKQGLLLSKAVQQNSRITHLLISGNPLLADTQLLPCTVGYLFNTLQVLNLSHCGIVDDHAMIIGTALCGNLRLKELYLDDNYITAGGAITLLVGLTQNECLELFSLCCTEDFEDIVAHHHGLESSEDEESVTEEETELEQASMEALRSVLESNCHLKRLHLRCTFIHIIDSALYHIAAGMTHNTTLIELNVSSFCERVCPVCVTGMDGFLQVIANNCTLTHLNLSGYDLEDIHVMQSLITVMDSNTTLTHLDLSFTNLNREEFGMALSRNLTLTELTHTGESILSFCDQANLNRRGKRLPYLKLVVPSLL